MKNTTKEINERLGFEEGEVSKLEDIEIKSNQSEAQRVEILRIKWRVPSELYDNLKHSNRGIIGTEGKETQRKDTLKLSNFYSK